MLLWAAFLYSECSAGGGHSHGEWAFAAVYDLHGSDEVGNYSMFFHRNSKYTFNDDHCKVLYMSTNKLTSDGIESKEEDAEAIWDGNATDVEPYNFKNALKPGNLYELELDNKLPEAMFNFNIPADGATVFFFQHSPSEFAFKMVDATGKEYEPKATEPAPKVKAEKKKNDNGGIAMLASIIVAFCTLVGIVFTLKVGGRECCSPGKFSTVLTSAFAAGTLFSTTAMLILPEGVRIIDSNSTGSESQKNFQVGICLFSGFFVGLLIHIGAKYFAGDDKVQSSGDVEAANAKNVEVVTQPWYSLNPKGWSPIVGAIILGDSMHNFVDGIAIAVAFQSCNVSTGWVVALGAILHEVPQEASDFLLLTMRGKMKVFEALFMNFLSGLSCVIGAAIALAADIDGLSRGVILVFAAGQYFWIATVECFPRILEVKTSGEMKYHLTALLLGLLIISLVLLFHEHCEDAHDHGHGGQSAPKVEEAGHAGHGH